VRRFELAVATGGAESAGFAYDIVERHAVDAAVIAAHFVRDGVRHVVLRSALRPPLALTTEGDRERAEAGVLWELPAGLIEPGESPVAAAARELNEEIGAKLDESDLLPLGAAVMPAPAMIAERQYLFHAEIDEAALVPAAGDGSALERASVLAFVPLTEALSLARRGALPDAKTEIGLRRLTEVLA
jgi:ADP-ribose pyrophosphatase